MRFVLSPDVTRLVLKDGSWIEVKRQLTAGEERAYRSAGFRRVSQRKDEDGSEIDVDWTAMAFARAEAFIVDWSARTPEDKPMPVSRTNIRTLHPDDFAEIDAAIVAHMEAVDAEKKLTPSGSASSTASPL